MVRGTSQTNRQSWPRIALIVTSVVAAMLGANAVRLAFDRSADAVNPASRDVPLQPYTVVLDVVRRDPGRPPVVLQHETSALRGDGGTARLTRGVVAAGAFVMREIHFPDGRFATTNDIAERVSFATTTAPVRRLRDPSAQCLDFLDGTRRPNQTLLGEDSVEGYRTVRIRRSLSIGAFAPELGCALLWAEGTRTDTGRMTRELRSVSTGEPDPVLFSIANDYREVESGELFLPGELPGM